MNWGEIFLNAQGRISNNPSVYLPLQTFPSISFYSFPSMSSLPRCDASTQNFTPYFYIPSVSGIDEASLAVSQVVEQNDQVAGNPQNREQNINIAFSRCTCSKSQCQKEYCSCFKNGKGCNERCSCQGCKNIQDSQNENRQIRKKTIIICNCTKSKCSKKYCECYAAGRKCGEDCKCLDCRN